MSVIAVEVNDNNITFISDSQITYANQAYLGQKKIIKVRNIVVGSTGKARILPLIERYLNKYADDIVDIHSEQLVLNLIRNIEQDAKLTFPMFTDDVEILITDSINVWLIHPTTNKVLKVDQFDAIGSGADYAIGSYKACNNLVKAIEIACESDIYCSLPANIEKIILS